MIDTPQAKAFRYRSMPAGFTGDVPGRAAGYMTDAEWVGHMTRGMPVAWQDAIYCEWRAKHDPHRQAANLLVCRAVAELTDAARAGLRLDASDEDIRMRARVFARHYGRGVDGRGADGVQWARGEMDRHGLGGFWPGLVKRCSDESALLRVRCETFWRRVLRKVFARTIEACSIGLGLVNKDRDCYVSNLRVSQRRQQLARNAEAAERTELENEYGQRMKLSDLIGRSTGDRAVRRAELMTRISGFDVIALDCGHEGTFITVTCPSRMHKWADKKYAVVPNPRYDGTLPGDAHRYLAKQFEKCRSALHRRGVAVYGFRVVEPHHDGSPHWHLMLFHEARHTEVIRERFLHYFLMNDSATERGAAEHRVTFERIDRTKGSAVAYLAKYVAKNIDGYKVGADLYGNPAIESSRRVDAWASTWRIRQFQQLGGAPVTVWRELRRINPEALPDGLLPKELTDSMSAVNIGQTGALWAQGWAAYVMAQGGPTAKRAAMPVRLLRAETGEVNRYAEVKPADVIGIQCAGRNWHKPGHMVEMLGRLAPLVPRPAAAVIESERAQWRVVGEGKPLPTGEAGRPWTRVNNCTRTTMATPEGVRSVAIVHRSKLGRWRPISRPEAAPGSFPASTE